LSYENVSSSKILLNAPTELFPKGFGLIFIFDEVMIIQLGWSRRPRLSKCGTHYFHTNFDVGIQKTQNPRVDEKKPQHTTQQFAQSRNDESMAHQFDLL